MQMKERVFQQIIHHKTRFYLLLFFLNCEEFLKHFQPNLKLEHINYAKTTLLEMQYKDRKRCVSLAHAKTHMLPHPRPYRLAVGCSHVYVCGARRALLAICIHLTLSVLTYLNFLFYSHRAHSSPSPPTCTKNTCTSLQGVQKQSSRHVPSDRLYISAAVLYVPVCVRCVCCMFTAALQSLSTSSIVS